MTRYLLLLALGGAALLAPGRALAQEKPSLNTAPGVPTRPAPVPVQPTAPVPQPEAAPVQPAPAPVAQPLPTPSYNSPSGFELPQREQERKAAEQHAEMYSKLFIYSGIGLGYSSYYGYSNFNFSISPALGYRLNDRVSVGPGISYAYNHYGVDRSISNGSDASTSSFGVKVFGQVRIFDQFFIHGEYESTRAEFLVLNSNYAYVGKTSRQVQTPLAGVGYRSIISNRAAADILLLYNFKDNYESIYPNPVIRFNFLFNIGK